LWVRPLDSRLARELPESEDATEPFWSPDGQSWLPFAAGFLKTVSLRAERAQAREVQDGRRHLDAAA
jgi:hypothetical protein